MTKKLTLIILLNLLCVCALVAQTSDAVNAPQTAATTFTYQGKLSDGAVPAAANYDFEFRLYDAVSGGTQQGATVQKLAVPVANGIFTASLDFGNQFPGADRFLDISVRLSGSGVFTTLTPRQPIAAAPHAVRSLSAATADTATTAATATNATQLGGVAASQFVVTGDTRLSDARPPTAGSANYIQNTTSAQAASFNIAGSGMVGSTFTFGPIFSPAVAPAGQGRLYFDPATNKLRASENGSTYVNLIGASGISGSGTTNFVPLWNAITTVGNSLISQLGNNIGIGTVTPSRTLDVQNPTGNSVIQAKSGSGGGGIILLDRAAASMTSSSQMAFLTAGSSDFAFGTAQGSAGVSDLSIYNYGTASNALTIQKMTGNVGVGTTTPTEPFVVSTNFGSSTAISLENTSSGSSRKLFLSNYGTTGAGSFWPGQNSANTSSLFAPNPLFLRSSGGLIFSGSNAGENMRITSTGNVGIGTANPAFPLHVVATAPHQYAAEFTNTAAAGTDDGVYIRAGSTDPVFPFGSSNAFLVQNQAGLDILTVEGNGMTTVNQISVVHHPGSGSEPVCWSGSLLASCSSSFRYKTNIGKYHSGLNLVKKFNPIKFDWKKDGKHDLGLGAEDVARIDPLLVTYNEKGEVEGVKYDRISVVLVNAVKEQQAQIKAQQSEIDMLRALMCRNHRKAEVCQGKK